MESLALGKSKPDLEKKLNIASIIISALVIILVVVMRSFKIDLGIDFSFLPPVHALLNTFCAVSLLMALYAVKNKNIVLHRNSILAALGFSALFLICYVLYHFTTVETKYCGEGFLKPIYFFLLISHIILAALSLPFILLTFSRGISNQVERHKKMARFVYPIWLYVAISGPVCYLMLRDCYI
jgi:putative membrane protein